MECFRILRDTKSLLCNTSREAKIWQRRRYNVERRAIVWVGEQRQKLGDFKEVPRPYLHMSAYEDEKEEF